jgi:Uma2 family endonuclease
MVAPIAVMTADQLLTLPDDGMRHELVAGELRTMSPTGHEHGLLTIRFAASLLNASDSSGIGEVSTGEPGYRLARNPDTVRAPDVAFLRTPRGRAEKGFPEGPPDLVVEVVSPNDLYTELDEKVDMWLAAGATIVFVVDPRRETVTEHRANAPRRIYTLGDSLSADDLLPGWTLALSWLFGGVGPRS